MTKTSPRYATEKLHSIALTIALFLLGAGSSLHAGSHTWSGAVNHLWSNPGNWQSGGVPVAGEANLVLYFPAGATTYQVSNNIAGLTVKSMVFSDTYIVRGNAVTLAPQTLGWNFQVSGDNNQATVRLPLALPAGEFTVRATSTCSLYLEGAISGPGSLHKDDAGTLAIGGDSGNTFTGGFHQREGKVYLYKQSGVALPGPVVVGVSNSTVVAVLEYSDHNQIADLAEVFIHGSEARMDLDGFNDTIGSLTLVDSRVSTEGFSTVGQLRLNGDLTSRQRSTSGNYVPMVFGRLSLGNVARNFNVATNSSLYLYADIESTGIVGGINLRGGGHVRLEGSNTFGGLLRLIEGSVGVEHTNALGSTTGATSLEGGRLIVDDLRHTFLEPLLVKSSNATVYCYGTNAWNGLIQLDPGTRLTLYGPSFGTPDIWTVGGVISGAGDVHISSMELDIVGATGNTFSGRTEIRSSAVVRMNKTSGHALSGNVIHIEGGNVLPQLRWKRNHQVPDTARIEFPASSTASGDLYLENHSDTIGSLHHGWSALISCGTGTLTIGANNQDGEFVGSISGNNGATNLIKIGTGSFTLRGNHSLAGKVVVNGGALILDNTSGVGPVHVNNNARLAGQGVFGALTVGPTASITPGLSLGGNSYGTLRPATFNLGGGYLGMQLGGTNAGSSQDQIVVTGPVNLNGVLLQLSALNLPHGSNSFRLIDVTSGEITGTFVGAPEGTVFPSSDGKLFRITYQGGTGNDVVVTRHYTMPPGGTMTGVSRLPDGRMRIGGTGLPFESYHVLANTNLSTTNWITIGSVSSGDEFGTLEFLDNDAPNHPMRFYRLVLP